MDCSFRLRVLQIWFITLQFLIPWLKSHTSTPILYWIGLQITHFVIRWFAICCLAEMISRSVLSKWHKMVPRVQSRCFPLILHPQNWKIFNFLTQEADLNSEQLEKHNSYQNSLQHTAGYFVSGLNNERLRAETRPRLQSSSQRRSDYTIQ